VPLICAVTVFFLTKKTKKSYISTTTLYTGVASGYSITSTGDERLDYFAVNNAFDNLLASAKSRETIEQVALHLLAEHLSLQKPDIQVLGPVGFEDLKKVAGKDLLGKARKLKDVNAIYNYVSHVYLSKADNVIAKILTTPGTFYTIKDLTANIVVARISTSDMLSITYTCSDPAVCQRTLELHTSIFTYNYQRLKSDQTYSAVQYFESKLKDVKSRLQTSEDNLKTFGKQNRVINYYEQTRYIAQSKEENDKEIYGQKVIQSGSQTALTLVEKKLNSREKQITNSVNVINLRQHLSEVNANFEKAKIFGNPAKASEYQVTAKKLEDSIRVASNQYMRLNYTLESVPRSSLIQEWVNNAIELDKATSALEVRNKQKQFYLDEIDVFAPLGSTLKRLERQVDVDEKEYLAILQGLNLARLRQSNLSLSSNIAIQDKPFFPLEAQPSTRNLLIIVSLLVGFILVAAVIIGREAMDSSLRTPERARKILGLPLIGMSIANNHKKVSAYTPSLRNLLMEQMINNMLPFISSAVDETGRAQVSFLTTKNDVYKSDDISLLHNHFTTLYPRLCWVVPEDYRGIINGRIPQNACAFYKPAISQLNYRDVLELINDDFSTSNVVFYLTPNIAQHSLPLSVAKKSILNIMVFSGNDTWQPADKEILMKVKKGMPAIPLFTWLVNMDEANLDSTIGEIPKSRSWIRRKVKKVLTLNLR
jgi:uncharacterized protein involved in exopolysaccharide biosynthesis